MQSMLDHHPGSVLTFLRNIRRCPRATGAIFPSGSFLAHAMVQHIDPSRDGMVVELGPGTGVFTKALLNHGVKPENLLLIEYNPDFVRYLRKRFRGVTVVHGSAFDVEKICHERGIDRLNGVISGMPLLNFSKEERYSMMKQCMRLLAEGAQMSQFTYSQVPSVKACTGMSVSLCRRVWLNIPPATVWIYTPERGTVQAEARQADVLTEDSGQKLRDYAGAA